MKCTKDTHTAGRRQSAPSRFSTLDSRAPHIPCTLLLHFKILVVPEPQNYKDCNEGHTHSSAISSSRTGSRRGPRLQSDMHAHMKLPAMDERITQRHASAAQNLSPEVLPPPVPSCCSRKESFCPTRPLSGLCVLGKDNARLSVLGCHRVVKFAATFRKVVRAV